VRAFVLGFAAAVALSAPAGHALQEFTLEEARTRIERLEARVAALEAQDGGSAGVSGVRHDIEGVVLLSGVDNVQGVYSAGLPCKGTGGFADIREGAEVVVLDGGGGTVDTAPLGPGSIAEGPDIHTCQFKFAADVPETGFYEFEVAGRGGPTYSLADLEAAGWRVELSIGG
jgi:hypothetical protein